MKTDCLIIGFNDFDFKEYVEMVQAMGTNSGSYKDLSLAFARLGGIPYRSMDLLNMFYFEGKSGHHKPFHNADFLWPVITYLSSFLARQGFSYDYVNLFQLEKDKLKEKLLNDDILAIAVTTTLYVSPHPVLEIVSFIRKYNDKAKIIVGGPYISNQRIEDRITTQRLFNFLGADIYVTCQEGEFALTKILEALKNNMSLDDIDNIAYKNENRYVFTKSSIESNPLEDNMVDYKLFPKEEIDQFVTIRTAKSCPFSCAFCGFPARAGKYKYLNVDLVEQELNAIREIGEVTTLTFIDDTFNVPKARFKDLLRMMTKNRYGFKWNCFYRCDHGDEETIELMGKAGCEGVFLGVESGSDQMLERMNKSARRHNYMKAIPLLRQAGISTYASLIIGFPGETLQTFQETLSFVEEAKPDFFRAQLWYCDPLTPIWNEREKYGIKGVGFSWSHDTMDSEIACDLIDKIFLSARNSIWLPQFGFEQWSTFYLQRKGMSMNHMKAFLECFNTAVKERLLYNDMKGMSPELLESLKVSCRFDEPTDLDMEPAGALSGDRYLAAEDFWINEFKDSLPSLHNSVLEAAGSKVEDLQSEAFDIDLEMPGAKFDQSNIVLAAFSILLSRLSGRTDTSVICSISRSDEEVSVPLRLAPAWNLTFDEFLQNTEKKLQQAVEHKAFAFHILTNSSRMGYRGASRPSFDTAYIFCDSGRKLDQLDFKKAMECHLESHKDIRLILKVAKENGQASAQFQYKAGWFTQQSIEQMKTYLRTILHEVVSKPDILLTDIVVDGTHKDHSAAVDIHASEAFNF